jgi:hypothetical protein
MNRLFAVAPVALLSTACAVRTPATALDARGDIAPATHPLVLPSVVDAIASWALPTNSVWSRYEKLTLLTYLADMEVTATMPDVGSLDVVRRARQAAARLAAVGMPQDTMWVVDLRGAASVAFGATLSQRSLQPVAPVMTFNNWPADDEVVPAEQTLAALVTMRPRPLPAGEIQATPIFLLDAWRLALRDTPPDPTAMDNRYVLLSSDFPDPATLLARGIRRVVYVIEDGSQGTTEEDDFHEVALAYQQAGIAFALVDLEHLAGLEGFAPDSVDERWAYYLDGWSCPVRVRSTIFDGPWFYQQARGGFGGVRAAPGGRAYVAAHPVAGATMSGSHGAAGNGGMHGRAYSGASPHVSSAGGGHGSGFGG